jgi:hypothetical protein
VVPRRTGQPTRARGQALGADPARSGAIERRQQPLGSECQRPDDEVRTGTSQGVLGVLVVGRQGDLSVEAVLSQSRDQAQVRVPVPDRADQDSDVCEREMFGQVRILRVAVDDRDVRAR